MRVGGTTSTPSLEKICRKSRQTEALGFFFFLSWNLFCSFTSTHRSTCAPGKLCSAVSINVPTCCWSPEGTILLWREAAAQENRAIPCNLPAQLLTSCGLPLSHELLYSKAKLSSGAEKVTGRQGPPGTEQTPSIHFPGGLQVESMAFPSAQRAKRNGSALWAPYRDSFTSFLCTPSNLCAAPPKLPSACLSKPSCHPLPPQRRNK